MDQDFKLVLTPTQLAAVMSGATLEPGGSWQTRAWGGAKLLFGGLETLGAGALLLTPEPTMVTKVGGAALGVHGLDTVQSGARQLWSGHEASTLTSEGSAALAAMLGVDEDTARKIGEGIDIAVPVALTLGLAAVRVAAVRSGRIILAEHEAAAGSRVGGHTIARHVGLTDAQLAVRLAGSVQMRTASTFSSLAEAEQAISAVVRANRIAIAAWARTAKPNQLTKAFDGPAKRGGVGRVLRRGATATVPGQTVRVVFRKQAYNGKLFYILTAYPRT